jgi:hypothetical protein
MLAQVTEIAANPIKRENLDTADAFILDNGPSGIFVWVGKGANTPERLHSMKLASEFIVQKGCVFFGRVCVCVVCCGLHPARSRNATATPTTRR